MRGERRLAARAVGDDLVALVEAAGVPHLAHRPPARLDVVVVHRHVGVVEVDPEADPLGQPVPVLDVAEDRLAAARVELRDPVLLDLGLGGDPELLLDLELDRQPVAVPAGLARHAVAGHRPVARVDVLEDPARGRGAMPAARWPSAAPRRSSRAARPAPRAGRPGARRRRAPSSARAPPPRGPERTAWGLPVEIPPLRAILRAGRCEWRGSRPATSPSRRPRSSSRGLCATSHGWPSGSMKTAGVAAPEGLGGLAADRRPGRARLARSPRRPRRVSATLWARVTPPQPPESCDGAVLGELGPVPEREHHPAGLEEDDVVVRARRGWSIRAPRRRRERGPGRARRG